jgi:hypothetical protein
VVAGDGCAGVGRAGGGDGCAGVGRTGGGAKSRTLEAHTRVHHRGSGPPPPTKAPAQPRRVQLTDSDRELLAFAAEHRLVHVDQIGVLLGVGRRAASDRFGRLTRAGLLVRDPSRLYRQPGTYQLTREGLKASGSDLPRPRPDSQSAVHDIGVGWVWLAARAECFGLLNEIVSERRMRSHDGTEEGRREPFGVRLGGVGPAGRDRLHYPDLLLVTRERLRIALELELTGKDRMRREKILAGYGADPRIDAVVYLVEIDKPGIGRAIQDSARRLGISDLIHIQRVRWDASKLAQAADPRAADRARGSERRTAVDLIAEAAR